MYRPLKVEKVTASQAWFADWIEAIFNLSIPITVAVSTIILAIQQHVLIQNNREQDLLIAAAQRKTDLEITRSQREENKKIFHRQRVEDLETLQSHRCSPLWTCLAAVTSIRRPGKMAHLDQSHCLMGPLCRSSAWIVKINQVKNSVPRGHIEWKVYRLWRELRGQKMLPEENEILESKLSRIINQAG